MLEKLEASCSEIQRTLKDAERPVFYATTLALVVEATKHLKENEDESNLLTFHNRITERLRWCCEIKKSSAPENFFKVENSPDQFLQAANLHEIYENIYSGRNIENGHERDAVLLIEALGLLSITTISDRYNEKQLAGEIARFPFVDSFFLKILSADYESYQIALNRGADEKILQDFLNKRDEFLSGRKYNELNEHEKKVFLKLQNAFLIKKKNRSRVVGVEKFEKVAFDNLQLFSDFVRGFSGDHLVEAITSCKNQLAPKIIASWA